MSYTCFRCKLRPRRFSFFQRRQMSWPCVTRTPSRTAIPHVWKQLALAGSTVGTISGVCCIAAITYDVHRRAQIAGDIVDQKRHFQSACPNYRVDDIGTRGGGGHALNIVGAVDMLGPPLVPEPQKQEHISHQETPRSSTGTAQTETEPAQPSPVNNPEIYSSIPLETFRPNFLPKKSTKRLHEPDGLPNSNDIQQRLVDFRLRYSDDESLLPLSRRIHKLLEQGKIVEASQNFLDIYAISAQFTRATRREAAIALFYANLKENNIYLAKDLFDCIEKLFGITPALWELMVLALGKKGSNESVSELYVKYAARFILPPNLYYLVLRSLIETYRLEAAKTMLLKYLQRDKNCALAGDFLDGIWKKTRKVDILEGQFRFILAELENRDMPATEKLFNPVFKAFIDQQLDSKAEALLHEMTEHYHISVRMRSAGLIAYAKALKCDWDGVEDSVREFHEVGLTSSEPREFAKVFHRLLLEYFLANSGKKTHSFIMRAVNEYALVPDQVLFDRIVQCTIEKGDGNMMQDLIAVAEAQHWDIHLDKATFMEAIRKQRLSAQMGKSGLWAMYRASEHKHKYAATSKQVLGYERFSFPMAEAYRMPWTGAPVKWWDNALTMVEPSKPLNQFAPLHKQMLHYMQAGKMAHALILYQCARDAGFIMKHLHVELAVTASIIRDENIESAKDILAEVSALRAFAKPVAPLYFQQLMAVETMTGAEALKLAVLNFYALLERRFIPFKHELVTSIGARLIRRREPDMAVELLRTIYESKFGAAEPFNDITVKVLVRAFADAGNLNGVRWAIFTAISRPTILTRTLVSEILRIIEILRLRHPSTSSPPSQSAPSTPPSKRSLQEDYEAYIEHLSRLSELLVSQLRQAEADDNTSTPHHHQPNVSHLIEKYRLPQKHNHIETPPTPPSSKDGKSPSHPINDVALNLHDVEADFVQFNDIVNNWRERSELDRCLSSSPSSSVSLSSDLEETY